MNLHSDFSQRVVLPANDARWSPSPIAGCDRRLLDGVSDASAAATRIDRYASGTVFTLNALGCGEELLVLEGGFSDESGIYAAGSYLRNPPSSAKTAVTTEGCTLFIKQWQFAPNDRLAVRIDTQSADWYPGLVPGLSVMPLHEHDGVSTALVRWAPDTRFNTHAHPGGEEILVLDGVFSDEHGDYPAGSWIRSPRWSRHTPFTGAEGALIYVKVGAIGAEFMTRHA
jgi:anti-sigma factor ChrR (cupin superfamily)